MKRSTFVFVLPVVAAMTALGCTQQSEKTETPAARAGAIPTRVVTLDVDGMTCGGCEAAIKMAVKKVDGVQDAKADYESGTATITLDPEKADVDKVIAAIEGAGYKAKKKDS